MKMSCPLSLESPSCKYVTWKVRDAFKIPTSKGDYLQSPEFHVGGDPHCLRLYQDQSLPKMSINYVSMVLVRLAFSVPGRNVLHEIGLRLKDGKEVLCLKRSCSVESVGGHAFYIDQGILLGNRNNYVPGGTLTVFCLMRLDDSCNIEWPKSETSSVYPVLAFHEESERKGLPGVGKLQSDYKQLLLKGSDSDVCIMVKGKEFRAHRCILRARSSVFDAMLGHETAEKKSGRLVIDNLDPDRFGEFLEYVYTGRLEAFSVENAFGLYAAADKYDVPTLRSECVEYMRRALSVDTFCDVTALALRHREEAEDLMELVVEFFKRNVGRIVETANWRLFSSEYNNAANELLMKVINKVFENFL